MFKKGDIVWGKIKSYPWWPAIIINPEDCGRDGVGINKFWICWFGDHKVSEVECNQLLEFQCHFAEKFSKKGKKKLMSFKIAVQEVLTVLATRCNIEFSDPSTLFDWAAKGFISGLQLPFRNSNFCELPDVVINALKKKSFKRKFEDDVEEDEEDEIVHLLDDISKGNKDIEDVCVMCCKLENVVIQQHPLFHGGVCYNCKKFVQKVMIFPRGQINVICVLCGQGGNLVYCSNSSCKTAYCETCIDYMVSKEFYLKILNDDKWKCYLCEPNYNFSCLIKRREVHSVMPAALLPIPVEKLPICVMSHCDAALSILKEKNISVGTYAIESSKCLETSTSKKPVYITDFTMAEMNEIKPDLIYGSFFVSPTVLVDQKKSLESFAASFYKFIFRLLNARLIKSSLFFMYIASGEILDADIMSQVMKFLRVDPFKIKHGIMKVYIWTNVPVNEMHIKNGKVQKCLKDLTLIEKDVLKIFLEPLKIYFKQEK